MKNTDLFESIGMIDEKYLQASEIKPKQNYWKWLFVPSSVLVGATGFVLWSKTNVPMNKFIMNNPIISVIPEIKENLVKVPTIDRLSQFEMSFGIGGMGITAVDVRSIDDLVGIDWLTGDPKLKEYAVYKNFEFMREESPVVVNPDLNRMKEILFDLANYFEMDIENLEIKEKKDKERYAGNDPGETIYAYEISDDYYRIEVNSLMEATIHFLKPYPLPKNISNEHHASYDEIFVYGEYCLQEFDRLIDMENPQMHITGGDYNIYEEQSYTLMIIENNENIIKKSIDFWTSSSGKEINGIRIYYPNEYEKIGDYPIISLEEATQKMLSGQYVTKYPKQYRPDQIYGVEFIYRNTIYDKTIMPYYVFYVKDNEITQVKEGHNGLVLYYVPAIQEQYISNIDVWTGSYGG